ncbi:mono/diheme cytochrome c family protein [Angulomicrobium tetraedrale]|uniref:Mono/diheme cytochrome c family protein n=1 Tax=Ancylobacter tetraedralis TaxID=217068 RepID=A0A839Z6J6_9HYPH|nr:Isoquinoline 1-oxidoreductase subunit [Ancylobacter tetraedralis]MBB3771312.1 mono/diheme cytochrome c family protein [Ancylobacter tetraedralis]
MTRAFALLAVPLLVAAVSLTTGLLASRAVEGASPTTLAPPESFAGITNTRERSLALFGEIGKVLTSPRCMNCHSANDRPRQGDSGRLHQPPVFRGVDGMGLPAMRCSVCHQKGNFDAARMPGHDPWAMAPREMVWEGRTLGQICVQMSDPARNGGKSLADLVVHIGDDTLVGWGWAPGIGRTPAPGTQKEAKALVQAWVDTGAACP